jgi:hypothetical protein
MLYLVQYQTFFYLNQLKSLEQICSLQTMLFIFSAHILQIDRKTRTFVPLQAILSRLLQEDEESPDNVEHHAT